MCRILFALWLAALAMTAGAQPMPPPPPDQLAPPVEHVLARLSLDEARRAQVRQLLLRQREERRQADAAMRERHRAELAALLTPDQLVAIEAALPRPGTRPPHAPPPQHPR